MTCSTSFLNKAVRWQFPALLLLTFVLSGCAGLRPDKQGRPLAPIAMEASPQMVGTGPISWSLVEPLPAGEEIRFQLRKRGGAISTVQRSTSDIWSWVPQTAGRYQVRILLSDQSGKDIAGEWSAVYEIVPEIQALQPEPDRSAPQAAKTEAILWQARVTGGVGPLVHTFDVEKDGIVLKTMETATLSTLALRPMDPGNYRLRVRSVDARGNQGVSPWSEIFKITPALKVNAPVAGLNSPQVIDVEKVPWSVSTEGGVGELSYQFEWSRIHESFHSSEKRREPSWVWRPEQPGTYRVRVRLTDALGNQKVGGWSVPFQIVAPLQVDRPSNNISPPQAAESGAIRWQTAVKGGVPPYNYQFELAEKGQTERFVQQGRTEFWNWRPGRAGSYRIRVTVIDALGYRIQSAWSKNYLIVPPLQIEPPQAMGATEQFALSERIEWRTRISGGVGLKNVVFQLQEQGTDLLVDKASRAPVWHWKPQHPGIYRVRAIATDSRDNQRVSLWSKWKEVRAPLAVKGLRPSLPAPQTALGKTVQWQAETVGGVGLIDYEFRIRQNSKEVVAQRGPGAELLWRPRFSGLYQFKVKVTDAQDRSVESAWSSPYEIKAAMAPTSLIAYLPLENLSGKKVPANSINSTYRKMLEEKGLRLLSREKMDSFMYRHRVRYTGGISSELAKALRDEEGVSAVFVTSLENYGDVRVPQVALTSRLVLCHDLPRIAWIDAVGITGDDEPGLLALKRVSMVERLLDDAMGRLVVSLENYLKSGHYNSVKKRKGLQPDDYYLASSFETEAPYRIAIVPFLNRYARRNAGFIVPLHLVSALHNQDNLEVFEPGLVREQLLKYRLIMRAGPSLATADVLASETTLGADLVLSGYVFDYQDEVDNPKVDFSTRLFSGKERGVVWWSRSHATGSDGVYFYDLGRERSVHVMLQKMTTAISDLLTQ